MRHLIYIIVFFALINTAKSQTEFYKTRYNISYFGNNTIYPGLKIGADYKIGTSTNLNVKYNKKKGEIVKINNKSLFITADMGAYVHPKTNSAFFMYSQIKSLYTRPKGFQFSYAAGLGYYRSILKNTYKVDDAGIVKKVFFPGNNYMTSVFSLGIGKQARQSKRIESLYLNYHSMIVFGYNATFVPLYFIELGVRF